MRKTKTSAPAAAVRPTMLEIVKTALEAKDRMPCQRPMLGLGNNLDHYDVVDLYLEQQPGGWVANIAFQGLPAGEPNTIGTPDASPYPSKQQAFLAGAALLCRLLTGSEELPFIATNDKLMVVGYGTGGFAGMFSLSRPAPWT